MTGAKRKKPTSAETLRLPQRVKLSAVRAERMMCVLRYLQDSQHDDRVWVNRGFSWAVDKAYEALPKKYQTED